jgi:hypothetical protein
MATGFLFSAVLVGVVLFVVHSQNMLGLAGDIMLIAVAVGLALFALAWPFLVRGRYRGTAYAVTSQRALAWDPNILGRMRFQEYDAADLARFYRVNVPFGGRDGAGTLVFGAEASKNKKKKNEIVRYHGFFYIGRAVEVEKLLRDRIVNPYTDRLYQ